MFVSDVPSVFSAGEDHEIDAESVLGAGVGAGAGAGVGATVPVLTSKRSMSTELTSPASRCSRSTLLPGASVTASGALWLKLFQLPVDANATCRCRTPLTYRFSVL